MRHERRTFVSEIRSSKSGKFAGYAAVFSVDSDGLDFVERIRPGAFAKALKTSDPRALWNHNGDFVLGRKSAGTLRLWEDKKGLFVEIDPPETQWAKDLRASIDRGDVAEMSFGFTVAADEWTKENGQDVRTITEIGELFDVSPVTFPAYKSTTIEARNQKNGKREIPMLSKKATNEIDNLYREVVEIRHRCQSEGREPTQDERDKATRNLNRIDEIESRGFFDYEPGIAEDREGAVGPAGNRRTPDADKPDPAVGNDIGRPVRYSRTSKNGYEIRAAGDSKTFADLYGNGINQFVNLFGEDNGTTKDSKFAVRLVHNANMRPAGADFK